MSSTNTPWLGDACSLVDAFRSGERTPVEELDATLEAIESSKLNAFSFLDAEQARAEAARADVSLPLGGVPIGVKELDQVEGWPATGASIALKDRVGEFDTTKVQRLRAAGAVLFGMTTASEFGGVNLTRTKLNGATSNPWDLERTPGGSSGGAAAAVAGGLVTLSTAGDGGGSIRIPAGFCGMVGMKGTFGRIPRGPRMVVGSMTVVTGCIARSVRDAARWYDVCSGFDHRDPYSLPRVEGWEAGLDSHDLKGKRAVIAPNLGVATVHPEVESIVREAAEALAADAGLELAGLPVSLPNLGNEWALAGMAGVLKELGDRYPGCADELTPEIAFGLQIGMSMYNLEARAKIEERRVVMNEALAAIFDEVDFVFASTNPDIAFSAEGPLPTVVDGEHVHPGNNGALTIPSNIYGNPAVSIPVGASRGLPVGLQVLGRHHEDALLFDLARIVEQQRPWPLVAPGSPV